DDDCDLKVPDHVQIHIICVNGDAKVTNLITPLTIDEVNGDLTIRHIDASVSINVVNADLSTKHIVGNVTIQEVNGDCSLQRIDGDVSVKAANGDLGLADIVGNISIAESVADIAVEVDFDPQYAYNFRSQDDIAFTLYPEPNVTFYLPAQTDYTFTRELKRVANILTPDEDEPRVRVQFGNGAAKVYVESADDVVFASRTVGGSGFSFEFNLGNQLRDIEAQINESLSGLGEMIEAQTREAIASASSFAKDIRVEARIQRAQDRAQRRAQRHAERAQRRMERAQRFDHRRQSPQTSPSSTTVSHEERLLILQMLQDGRITVEEANQLLSTLEGKV
ncbi:MAG: hypothetical protein CUN55_11400, partial [Phototrophicales bacterium]